MISVSSVGKVFESDLPQVVSGFRFRQEQSDLAESILSVIEAGSVGIFEAGTGTGKTLSYLVPAFLSAGTTIVSTGTKNLQDQIYLKDTPDLRPLFPAKRVALLKGRANYCCPYRLNKHIRVIGKQGRDLHRLVEVRQWLAVSASGDITELLDPEEDPALMRLVTSTRENCLGGRCPDFDTCPLYRARARAKDADIVIVNHHLLFADLSRMDDNLQSLLPDAGAIIVDEAHQLHEVARQFFGQRLSSGQFLELVRDVRTEHALLGNDEPLLERALKDLEVALGEIIKAIVNSEILEVDQWLRQTGVSVTAQFDLALEALVEQLNRIADRSEGLLQASRRAVSLLDQFALLTEPTDAVEDSLHWIDRRENGFTIHLSPVSIAAEMKSIVDCATAWVFTSATLTVDGSFDHFSRELGLTPQVSAVLNSPFDYAASVKAYLPPSLPLPGDEAHTDALVKAVLPLLRVNPGRTFFLFTSHRALRRAAQLLSDFERPVIVQGAMSRSRMMDTFRALDGAVLLATQSFWEGVDARGARLCCLIIDKLPFPNPAEPLFRLLSAHCEQAGGNSFADLSLPRAALSLRQGFGRLVREESDRGLFVIGDLRLRQRQYGGYFLASLPALEWCEGLEDARAWLQTL
ncbi:MAG: ATP-dependent DNA helicase [Proteobacteria bacterium]|nr:ATP-dependent DNA helicase [Pseudomonadota bacterium]